MPQVETPSDLQKIETHLSNFLAKLRSAIEREELGDTSDVVQALAQELAGMMASAVKIVRTPSQATSEDIFDRHGILSSQLNRAIGKRVTSGISHFIIEAISDVLNDAERHKDVAIDFEAQSQRAFANYSELISDEHEMLIDNQRIFGDKCMKYEVALEIKNMLREERERFIRKRGFNREQIDVEYQFIELVKYLHTCIHSKYRNFDLVGAMVRREIARLKKALAEFEPPFFSVIEKCYQGGGDKFIEDLLAQAKEE